ncbi:MAG: PhnD/SsuA/transferrin family substrate-binding protein [Planctomycetes bacterium]|nr:PhnD/SsuA/transferrin family substrate-binding protein [Planctomycetota bacterium]
MKSVDGSAALFLAVLSGLSAAPEPRTQAAEKPMVFIQPGYPGTTEEARGFVSSFCKVIRQAGGPEVPAGEYHNDEKEGLKAAQEKQPLFGIVSLGFYLKHAGDLSLQPLLFSSPAEPFHLVARKGAFKDLAGLKDKAVTGTTLLELEFVERILFGFADQGAAPAGGPREWKVQPVKLFSRGYREVAKGRQDAVLMSHREYQGLKQLEAAKELEAIHTTRSYPVAVVVAFGERLPAEQQAKLSAALKSFGKTAEGKDLLQTMGIDGFTDADLKYLKALAERYQKNAPESAAAGKKAPGA